MLCAISGEAPQAPVVSRKSGHLFEKRLIEAHIKEHHTDPVTGEDLETDDLLELKSARTLKPRPPTLTSIPSLLSAFQNEWDAIALETYNLRKELAQTRQELSTALYQHDAATRVIARLVKERDDAREALSNVTVSAGAGTNGDAMQVDSTAMSDEVAEIITSTQAELSGTRKKRPVPPDWATAEDVQSLDSTQATEPLYPGGTTLALDSAGELAIIGGNNGVAGIYSTTKREIVETIDVGAPVTAAAWWGSRPVVGTSTGAIDVFDGGKSIGKLGSHAGRVTSLSLHPSGNIMASTGVDKIVAFYDLSSLKIASQIYTDSEVTFGSFHPDGHLFGAGGRDGHIRLYDVVSGSMGADFAAEGPLKSLAFSENGYWLASASQGQSSVAIWDLRKMNTIKVLDIGSPVESMAWDYTGGFLAVAGSGCVAVQHYSKSSKKWSELVRKAVPSKGVEWGSNAKSLVALTADDRINLFAAS
ncbi:cell cycle control protein [Pseudovirgaria hyperparasitica]|uniref:Pre-mRNA-processing factor 19 n=1 Tax=Pseudovirgaria hyperparasitica TaxID=470096 RepID=A0A6A6WKQ7_9PEZI|nr:cell cycle control protein [Pseudovirgaria hyperparasitica]KAF2762752.1 cell cycle control protein [Pseudovirgaria hyperparasitica]